MLRLLRRLAFVILAATLVLAIVVFVSFRGAVKERNDQVPAKVTAALSPAGGPALGSAHVTLLVGADTSAHRIEANESHGLADSMMLMRVDVPNRTVSLLSIPRDLYVEIPGLDGRRKINEAFPEGGLPLAIRTVRLATGIEVNHVVQIDFDGFKEIVDELGGVEIDNPTPIQSGSCDECGFDGKHWRFRQGKQVLDGRNALAYARLRKVDEGTLARDPAEGTDTGRARRQQRVIDAIIDEVVSMNTARSPRDIPRALVQPLATDVTASQMLAFAFGKWWSKPENNLRCRLGGDEDHNEDGDVLIPNDANRSAVRMFLGKQAPHPPDGALSAGCFQEG